MNLLFAILSLMVANLRSELVPEDTVNFKTKAGYKYTGDPEVRRIIFKIFF